MSYFCDWPFVRVFFVVLAVLFVCGAGISGGAYARVDMQNGHEGDPGDSYDLVSGGNGDPDDGFDIVGGGGDPANAIGSSLVEKFVFFQNPVFAGLVQHNRRILGC